MIVDKLIPTLIIMALFLLGFINIFSTLQKLIEKRNFTQEYLQKYTDFIEGYKKNEGEPDLYVWLTRNVIKIQNLLGPYGKMALYRPPFASYAYQNYEIFTNTLSEIGRGQAEKDDMRMVAETLIRYLGVLDEQINEDRKEFKNPLIWFRKGVTIILLFPLFFLQIIGLSISGIIQKVANSSIVKIVSALLAIVTLIGGIFSIITGWDSTVKIISNWIMK